MTKPAPARPGDRVREASFSAGATAAGQFPAPTVSEIAFCGRSNVGKSSLLNSLLERRTLVRTSSTPGCTRQVSWFRAVCDDEAQFDLVDLPGYGYAKRSKSEREAWAGLIEDYLLGRGTLRGAVVLVDVRRGPEEDELQLLELLSSQPRTSRRPLDVVVVATKLDKLPGSQRKLALERIKTQLGRPVYGYSATEHLGRVPLWRHLRRIAGVAPE